MEFITPDWPAPNTVKAIVTTRRGGVSSGPYASLNLGTHVGDDPVKVNINRAHLQAAVNLPATPLWLQQVHGCNIAQADADQLNCIADATIAVTPGKICAILTADCLPILLCDYSGQHVAAIHGGWRGLLHGVVENTVQRLLSNTHDPLMAWLGPAIGPQAFEVGTEVRNAFVAKMPQTTIAFTPTTYDRWLADIYTLARQTLSQLGVQSISGGGLCTFTDSARFFSYRRDGVTGRMATLIWIE